MYKSRTAPSPGRLAAEKKKPKKGLKKEPRSKNEEEDYIPGKENSLEPWINQDTTSHLDRRNYTKYR